MKRNLFQKLGDFVLGKGFYIVLFLCVAAIGISGYISSAPSPGGSQPSEPVTANPTVTPPGQQRPGGSFHPAAGGRNSRGGAPRPGRPGGRTPSR